MNTLPMLNNFQNEINQLFDRPFFGLTQPTSTNETSVWYLEVDIAEQEKSYQIKSNLPGIDPKDIEIYFKDGILKIKGKLESKKDEKNKNYIQSECSYGEFSRIFSLLEANDNTKIEAEFKNGVLNITIPKAKNNSMKRIEIKI